jgi:hypothetical protein
MTSDDVREILRQECVRAGSQLAWATAHDLAATYISDVINGRREPGMKLLAALGVERIIIYRKT